LFGVQEIKNSTAEIAEFAEAEEVSRSGCMEKSDPIFDACRKLISKDGLFKNDLCVLSLLSGLFAVPIR
jgi:hypothetical protein